MINKISNSQPFGSKVKVVYDPWLDSSSQKFYDNKIFRNELEKLENNGNDDTVIIYPRDFFDMSLVVYKKDENGKLFSGIGYLNGNTKNATDAYKYAQERLKLVPDDLEVLKYLG